MLNFVGSERFGQTGVKNFHTQHLAAQWQRLKRTQIGYERFHVRAIDVLVPVIGHRRLERAAIPAYGLLDCAGYLVIAPVL